MHQSGLLFTKEHCWVKADKENEYYIGLTDQMVKQLGEIELIEIPSDHIHAADIIFIIETRKLSMEFNFPFDAFINLINPKFSEGYSIIHQDPYQLGWIVKIKINKSLSDLQDKLMTQEAYEDFLIKEDF